MPAAQNSAETVVAENTVAQGMQPVRNKNGQPEAVTEKEKSALSCAAVKIAEGK